MASREAPDLSIFMLLLPSVQLSHTPILAKWPLSMKKFQIQSTETFFWGGRGSGQLLCLIRKLYGPQLVFQCKEHREKPDDVMHPNKKLEQRWGATSGVLNVY